MTEDQQFFAPAAPVANSIFFDVAKFEHAQRVGKMLGEATMVPEAFKGNLGNCIIALNLADRMQVDPFMLMQNMYVIHGRPAIEAKLAIALINASGKFEPMDYERTGEEGKDSRTYAAYSKHIRTGKVCKGPAVSIKMAKDEGWYSKSGSKWKTMPELMLTYRAAMFFARTYCPEVLLGLQTRDEVWDTIGMEQAGNGTFAMTSEDAAQYLTEKIKNKATRTSKKAETPPAPTRDTVDPEKVLPGSSDGPPTVKEEIRELIKEEGGAMAFAQAQKDLDIKSGIQTMSDEAATRILDKMNEILVSMGE